LRLGIPDDKIGGAVKINKGGDKAMGDIIGVCRTCKYYFDCLGASGGIDQIKDDHTCEDWEIDRTDEELEAQRVDAAERENHRKDVEGEII